MPDLENYLEFMTSSFQENLEAPVTFETLVNAVNAVMKKLEELEELNGQEVTLEMKEDLSKACFEVVEDLNSEDFISKDHVVQIFQENLADKLHELSPSKSMLF